MRPLKQCSGATLLELLVALSLFGGFLAAIHSLVRTTASQTAAAMRRSAAGRDQLALWALATGEMANAVASDVSVPASTAVEFDRRVAEGPVCLSTTTTITMRSDHGGVLRPPAPNRDRLLAREPTTDGSWIGRGIVSVAVANCPDGRPALVLTVDTPIPAVGFARIVEPVRLRSYSTGGAHALGLEGRLGLATIQPFAGPLDPTAFEAVRSGEVLHLTLSRFPLVPLQLHLPLQPSP